MKYTPLAIAILAVLGGTFAVSAQAKPAPNSAGVRLTILHTNDHHGRFWKNQDGEYGLAAQKTLVDQIRQEVKKQGGQLLVLSGGDINTGVPESDIQDAEPDFKGMKVIGYDAMALGNHEFDNSLDVLKKQAHWAGFPFLSANIYRGGQRMFEPYKIFNKGGVRVAVMGLTTDDTGKLVNPDNLKYEGKWRSGAQVNPANKDGIEFRSPIVEANELVPQLRHRADIVIAATHMGHYTDGKHGSNAPGDVELARAVKGIDLIVGGHSQNPVCMTAENTRNDAYVPGGECRPDQQNGAWIVQAHEWGKYVGRADFEYKDGKLNLIKYQLIPVNLKKTVTNDKGEKSKVVYTTEIAEDPKLLKILTPFQEKGQEALKIKVGKSTGEFMGKRDVVRSQPTNLGVLIGTAMREKVKADFAVMNSGGIRDSLPEGDLTYRDVLKVQPFGNQVSYVDLSGAEVQNYLNALGKMTAGSGGFPQFANVSMKYVKGEATNIMIGGKPLNPTATYRMALNDFASAGGDGYPKLKGVHPTWVNSGFTDANVLKDYISNHMPLDPANYDPKNPLHAVTRE